MGIAGNLSDLISRLPEEVRIVAVSKTMPEERIMEAYNAGQRIFGENKVQELLAKYPSLPPDIEWHFIGHLQTNKVKHVVPVATLIHSADSKKLIRIINEEGSKSGKKVSVLLQIRIALEDTKYGMGMDEARAVVNEYVNGEFGNLEIKGLMGMATLTDNINQIKSEFSFLSNFFRELKNQVFTNDSLFNILSMGMSDDYTIAVEAGSNMIRIGSLIFGRRENN